MNKIYTCPDCGYHIKPTFWRWLSAMHWGKWRYFKCDKCGKISLMKGIRQDKYPWHEEK